VTTPSTLQRQYRLAVAFQEFNDRHFDGSLPYVDFTIGLSEWSLAAHGPAVRGETLYCRECGWVIGISERLFAGDAITEAGKATLLHEMCHLRLNLFPPPDYDGKSHGVSFANECNRIGAVLGYPAVYACDDDPCHAELEKCNYWPDPTPVPILKESCQ
jgi:hypothetical protein